MTQITSAKLKEMTTIELYNHYSALEHALPMLTDDSQDLVHAELESVVKLRSEKIDRIYYALRHHERQVEYAKEEQEKVLAARKHHESQVTSLKNLLSYLRRSLPQDSNRITGRNYEFTLSKKKDASVYVKSDPDEWTREEQESFCLQEETRQTKHTILRTLSGTVIDETTTPKLTTKTLPNVDALRKAFTEGQQLPPGVKVQQEYSIRTKRLVGSVDPQASINPREFLPED